MRVGGGDEWGGVWGVGVGVRGGRGVGCGWGGGGEVGGGGGGGGGAWGGERGEWGRRGGDGGDGGGRGVGVRGHRCPQLTRYLGLDARLVMRAQQLGLDGLYHTPETPAGTCQGEVGSQVLQPFKTHTVPSLRVCVCTRQEGEGDRVDAVVPGGCSALCVGDVHLEPDWLLKHRWTC